MNLAHCPTKILVTGRSGCGKSTYWERYLLNSSADKVFIYDHEGEFAFRQGLEPIYTLSDEIIQTKKIIAYDPSTEWEGDTEAGFAYYADIVFQISKQLGGIKLFAVDELQKLSGTDSISRELSCVIETGRRYGIDTCFVSQQANLIHSRLRNQLTEIITFRQNDRRAIEFLIDLGYEESQIRALADLEFLSLDLRTMAIIPGKIVFDTKLPKDESAANERLPDDTGGVDPVTSSD